MLGWRRLSAGKTVPQPVASGFSERRDVGWSPMEAPSAAEASRLLNETWLEAKEAVLDLSQALHEASAEIRQV